MTEQAARVELVGVAQAFLALQLWARGMGEAVEEAATPFGQTVAGQVASKVPRVTGTLAASVDVRDEPQGVAVSIGEDVPYAGWIEFGGSRGRPLVPQGRYLYPTALAAEPAFGALAAEVSEATVRSYPWPTPALL